MRKKIFFLVIFLFIFISCATVPLTGRRQVAFVPDQTLLAVSYQQYRDFIRENKLSDDSAQVEKVKTVGRRIQKAVEQYMADQGLSDRLKNYHWEFNLVENDQANAWCMPGGKVVVYTGMLSVTRDDNGLAVVIAHEIAHAVAGHGNERLSKALISNLGQLGLSAALRNRPEETRQLWMTIYGAGAQYGVLLPYGRKQEVEADYLGLIFMALAGYNPEGAVSFWQRMADERKGKVILEYLSTHPSDQTRIKKIKEKLPEAKEYYLEHKQN